MSENTTIQDFWFGAMVAREQMDDLRMRAMVTRFAHEQQERRQEEAREELATASGLRTDAACARDVIRGRP